MLQEIIAQNAYQNWAYRIHTWRTQARKEVDFILYGKRRLLAIEVKTSSRVRDEDLASLRLFLSDYPEAEAFFVYGGSKEQKLRDLTLIPADSFIRRLPHWLAP